MSRPFSAVLSTLLFLGISAGVVCPADGAVKLVQEDNRVSVTIDGKPFTEYYFGPEGGRPYTRPFMWPVQAGDGTVVTSDQTRAREIDPKEDHPHHRSLWVSHGDVNGADHWALDKGADQPKQIHDNFEKIDADTLVENLTWEDKEHKPMMKEKRTVRFFGFPDGNRGIDITSNFSAIDEPVKFGDTKEAGFTAVRLNKQITEGAVITLSTGATSNKGADKTKDKKAKKDAGDEANVWGKEADWCDMSGQIEGKPYGVAVLNNPSNPLSAKWHARRYGLIGANNIGSSAFDKNNPKIYTPFTIEPGKPATFKFRVIIHQGDVKAAGVAEKYNEYRAK